MRTLVTNLQKVLSRNFLYFSPKIIKLYSDYITSYIANRGPIIIKLLINSTNNTIQNVPRVHPTRIGLYILDSGRSNDPYQINTVLAYEPIFAPNYCNSTHRRSNFIRRAPLIHYKSTSPYITPPKQKFVMPTQLLITPMLFLIRTQQLKLYSTIIMH